MNPLLNLWRRLDRYLIRNHVGLWTLQVHRLHAGALMATAVLALVVFFLPMESLLEVALTLTVLVMLALLFFLLILPIMLSSAEPFVRRSRWPHSLSVMYCIFVISTPGLILPRMIQTRVRQHVLNGSDATKWSSALQSYTSDMPSWEEHCEKAIAEPGVDQEPVKRICVLLSPSLLSPPFLWGHEHTAWLSYLLLLLLLAQRSLLISSSDSDSFLAASVLLFGVFLTPIIGFFVIILPLPAIGFWIVSGTTAVLVLCLLAHVARAHRMTTMVIWSWSLILTGVPLLAIMGSSLLKPVEVHYQALYLGLVLLLAYWLEQLHDRLHALPS
jgi:hypothetical protein